MRYNTNMKSLTNEDVAKLLKDVAAAYSIKNESKYRFQILAYQKAADSIERLTHQVKDLIAENSLDKVPGVGSSLKSHLLELFKTGRVKHFDEVLGKTPRAFFPLLDVPGFGPKKAYKIVDEFDLDNPNTVIDDVYKLAKKGKIAPIPSFGEKSQSDIIRAIEEYKIGKTKSARMVLAFAQEIANTLLDYLKKEKAVIEAYPLGSLRRMKSTIGDVDIAVSSKEPKKVIEHFVNYPYKDRIIEKGDITASIITSGNKQIDLMVLMPEQMGSLLQHFTGSKEHNIKLREYAIKKGYSLSEKGIKLKNGKLKTFRDEESFYGFLGLDWIPPEIRENQGEIEAAAGHELPKLVTLKEIRGEFHVHSSYPIEPSHDLGANDMQVMLNKAKNLGYEYLGFSEHNPSIGNHSESEIYNILVKRNKKIEQLKLSNKYIRIINLLEVDILASGKLALSDRCLNLLDMAIVSIHSSFSTGKSEMTKRILKGLSHPKAKILAHPTGRMINSRSGYEANWNEIFTFVKKTSKALEINAWPTRLDLPDNLVRIAKNMGVKFAINTDSHEVSQMDNMKFGVSVARRGWCEKKDIINYLPYEELAAWMKR